MHSGRDRRRAEGHRRPRGRRRRSRRRATLAPAPGLRAGGARGGRRGGGGVHRRSRRRPGALAVAAGQDRAGLRLVAAPAAARCAGAAAAAVGAHRLRRHRGGQVGPSRPAPSCGRRGSEPDRRYARSRPGGSRRARTCCPRRSCRSPGSPPRACPTGRSASGCTCRRARSGSHLYRIFPKLDVTSRTQLASLPGLLAAATSRGRPRPIMSIQHSQVTQAPARARRPA